MRSFRSQPDGRIPAFQFLFLCSTDAAFRQMLPVLNGLDRSHWIVHVLLPVSPGDSPGEDVPDSGFVIHHRQWWRINGLKNRIPVRNLLRCMLWSGPVLARQLRADGLLTAGCASHLAGTVIGICTRTPVVWYVTQASNGVALFVLRTLAGFKRVRLIVCASELLAAQLEGYETKIHVLPPAGSAGAISELVRLFEGSGLNV